MANKVVIVIEGGVIQSVHSDDSDLEVEVVDWDNIKEMNSDLSYLVDMQDEVNEKLTELTEILW